jgi:sulfur-carrier protein adenylyltransferase/sulfurtransferase
MKQSNPSLLTREELRRYSRHILMSDFGLEGQEKLKQSKVLVIGAGGLGSPVLLYLAAAGVGCLGIVDADNIDETNLQRQVLYDTSLIGKPKAPLAAERIKLLNPNIDVKIHNLWLNSENALDVLSGYDLVIDGTDNFPTRYLVNDACVLLDKPLVYGSIFQFEGQVSVFNLTNERGERGPNYRDLFPEPPPPGLVPSCAEGGVLGVLPGIIGSMQANEAIKILAGIGTSLSGRLFIFDALNFESVTLKVAKNPSVGAITRLIDYEQFCGTQPPTGQSQLIEIGARQLASLMKSGESYQLVDVRQPHEYLLADIGGDKLPLAEIESQYDKIALDRPVIFYCRSGKRSSEAIFRLQAIRTYDNLFNLTGGILAYIDEVDPSLTRY